MTGRLTLQISKQGIPMKKIIMTEAMRRSYYDRARYLGEALQLASEKYEIPSYDLLVYLKEPPRPAMEISPEESSGLGGFYSGIDN